MKCYNCKAKLSEMDSCPKCGTDVRLYKKIVYTSNRYYNSALMRAKGRDLSGAAEDLRVCLQLNKHHIAARNLLGLIYYETGEAAAALKEWITSKNLKYRNNIADQYIQDLRDNKNTLDSFDHTIRKFNQALEYAQSGSKDMAIIQLKKVISVNHRMIKAYELLALLYIDSHEYKKAEAVLNRCLEIDSGNVCALSYKKELKRIEKNYKDPNKREVVGDSEREEVIIPVKLRDFGSYLTSSLYILIGVILAAGLIYYVVIPTKEREYASANQASISSYESKFMDLSAEVKRLNNQIEQLEEEKQNMDDELSNYTEGSGNVLNAYDALMGVLMSYINQDMLAVAQEFPNINGEAANTEMYQQVYNMIKEDYENPNNLYKRIKDQADALWNEATQPGNLNSTLQLTEAVKYYEACITMNGDDPQTIYSAGLCYAALNNRDQALEKFTEIIQRFPDTDNTEVYQNALNQIAALSLNTP